ncbi:purine-nucleoside phosphorylase [Gryllotalpicola koreensis]|uniref:Uridine phosphorylase n=1 Tax=Gryllotalpicola koreensis TaxID=993086 RepID=A0ABP7ZSK5_9MICO
MATPHISAEPGDFAPDVILPGDPLRARRIAEEWFDDAAVVSETRGILGYTGTRGGKPISVLASGMGMPSATIYATELVRFFGVRRIVRVGTAGGVAPSAKVRDVVVATGAHTDSSMSELRIPGVHFSHVASFPLLAAAARAAENVAWRGEHEVHFGMVMSTDTFYKDRPAVVEGLRAHGVLANEMEAAALYAVAAAEGCEALAVLTVSDRRDAERNLTAEEREKSFGNALEIALGALGL